MSISSILDDVQTLKEKFSHYRQQKKQLRALELYASVAPFQHAHYLFILRECVEGTFLGQKEADFLDHMLEKYDLNYLDWSHRSPWLKREMVRVRDECKAAVQLTMFGEKRSDSFQKQRDFPRMPLHLLGGNAQRARVST